MQTPTDPLAALRDIHLPAPVGWWPLAPAWWVLGAILFLAIALLTRRILAKRKALYHFAIEAFMAAENQYTENGNLIQMAVALSEILRRVALARYPREEVASLSGEDWATFLVSHGGKDSFQEEYLSLELATYMPESEVECRLNSTRLLHATKSWIKRNAA
ncbi:MAG: DUF4381 domain-containing protein [Planctomycetota bacterium]